MAQSAVSVAHIITELGPGGAQEMLARLCIHEAGSKRLRQTVVSLLDEGIHGAALRQAGIRVYSLNMRRGVPSPLALVRLIRILRRERPDIVMTWMYAADLIGTIAARITRVPRLYWNIRCSDIDFSRYGRTTRWTVAALSRLSRVPAGIAANSHAGRVAHEALGYAPRKWHYLPNGIDIEQWHPDSSQRTDVRAEFQVPPDAELIALIGRVDPMKDHATFLAAADYLVRRGRKVKFLIAGKGAESLDVPNSLRPHVYLAEHRRDGSRLLRGVDVLVMSSAFGEGFPNVVCEAMATGVLCAVTDVGDAAEIVGNKEQVVLPRDPEALAGAIERILNLSAAERDRLSVAGRDRVRRLWSLDSSAKRYRDLWDEAMDKTMTASAPDSE